MNTVQDDNTIEEVSEKENSYYEELLDGMSEEDKEVSSIEIIDL